MIVDGSAPEHLSLFRELLVEYAEWLDFRCLDGFEKELAELPGEYGPPSGLIGVALDEDKPAGCVAMRLFAPAVAEMKRLYVRPGYRGQGIGRVLVEHLLAGARVGGYRRVVLDSVPGVMDPAIALYKAFGFVETAPYGQQHDADAVSYELTL